MISWRRMVLTLAIAISATIATAEPQVPVREEPATKHGAQALVVIEMTTGRSIEARHVEFAATNVIIQTYEGAKLTVPIRSVRKVVAVASPEHAARIASQVKAAEDDAKEARNEARKAREETQLLNTKIEYYKRFSEIRQEQAAQTATQAPRPHPPSSRAPSSVAHQPRRAARPSASAAGGATVYIAPYHGKKYHRSPSCRGLNNADATQPISIEQARARGYTPCKICY